MTDYKAMENKSRIDAMEMRDMLQQGSHCADLAES